QIKEENLTGFEYMGDPIEITAKSAYWDHFADCLKKEAMASLAKDVKDEGKLKKDKQEVVYSALSEFKKKMKSLVPHRQDLGKYYDEYIDVDFIKQLMEHQLFKNEDLNGLIKFTFEQLKELDSIHGAKQIDKWMSNWELINNFY